MDVIEVVYAGAGEQARLIRDGAVSAREVVEATLATEGSIGVICPDGDADAVLDRLLAGGIDAASSDVEGEHRVSVLPATLAKGLAPWRVVWVHALGNVWVQLVTVIALTFGSLLEGAVLTETVFAWPGLGLYLKNSLFNADLNAVLGGTVLVGVVYIGLNMLSDLIYPLVDPRARDQ